MPPQRAHDARSLRASMNERGGVEGRCRRARALLAQNACIHATHRTEHFLRPIDARRKMRSCIRPHAACVWTLGCSLPVISHFFAVTEKGLDLVLFTRSFLASGRMEPEDAADEIGSCDGFSRRSHSICAANFFCTGFNETRRLLSLSSRFECV
jgi:hypothetical protein